MKFVPVTLLRDTPEGVWLTGLPETAEVIVIGQEYVTDGVRVTRATGSSANDRDRRLGRARARMVVAFIVLSILAGTLAYVGLPKEGEPDIEIPALFVSVQFPGISAEDSEKLLVKPMETELSAISTGSTR